MSYTDITNHYSTIIAIGTNTILNSTDKVLKVINYNKFYNILANNNWFDIYHGNDMNVCVDSLFNRITEAIDLSTTLKVNNSENKRMDIFWFTLLFKV